MLIELTIIYDIGPKKTTKSLRKLVEESIPKCMRELTP